MYRLIASDMDETFLDHRHRIPAPNLSALARLRAQGALFVPASGRGYLSIMDNFAQVDPALMEGSYVISYNGGALNRFGDPEPLHERSLDHGLADELWRLGVARGICLHAYTPDCSVLVRDWPASERTYLSTLKRVREYPEPDLSGVPVVSKMLYMSEDFAFLHRFADEVRPLLGGLASITYSSGRYLEVVPAGVDKGAGLLGLAGLLGIDVADTVGVGDSANDREMVVAAGLGVGVANVSDELRPVCDLVLSTPAEDGALPELVDKIF